MITFNLLPSGKILVNHNGSASEYALNGTSIGNLGKTIYSGYCDQKNNFNIILPNKLKLSLNTAKTQSDMLHLMATPIGAAGTLFGSISFTEIYE